MFSSSLWWKFEEEPILTHIINIHSMCLLLSAAGPVVDLREGRGVGYPCWEASHYTPRKELVLGSVDPSWDAYDAICFLHGCLLHFSGCPFIFSGRVWIKESFLCISLNNCNCLLGFSINEFWYFICNVQPGALNAITGIIMTDLLLPCMLIILM